MAYLSPSKFRCWRSVVGLRLRIEMIERWSKPITKPPFALPLLCQFISLAKMLKDCLVSPRHWGFTLAGVAAMVGEHCKKPLIGHDLSAARQNSVVRSMQAVEALHVFLQEYRVTWRKDLPGVHVQYVSIMFHIPRLPPVGYVTLPHWTSLARSYFTAELYSQQASGLTVQGMGQFVSGSRGATNLMFCSSTHLFLGDNLILFIDPTPW